MNTTTKLSTAIVLGLSLLGMSAAADAASARPVTKAPQVQTGATSYAAGKVIHLGTISVTRDDAEGAKAKAPKATQPKGTLFLGSISVTPADSVDARYAVAQAQQKPGSVFIGSIEVTAKSHRLPVIGTLVAAVDSTRSRNLLAAIGALVFARAGG
jgi:hypothetical protein